MDIKALAQTYEAYIVERRRYYHANPELSGQEEQTRRQIRKDLEAMGITEITELRDCFGMTATSPCCWARHGYFRMCGRSLPAM